MKEISSRRGKKESERCIVKDEEMNFDWDERREGEQGEKKKEIYENMIRRKQRKNKERGGK